MVNKGKYPILGVNVHAVDYECAVDSVIAAARSRRPYAVSALAVHGVMTGALDPMHRRRLNGLDLVVPDGQPVRWALRWIHGAGLEDRVYGPNLTLRILEAAAKEGLSVYFYGSTEDVLAHLMRNLRRHLPDLRIAGYEPSRFRRLSAEEKEDVVRRIRQSGARIVFVGLGCPRQEVWAYEYRERLSVPLIAVGAAFAFHAGTLPQAPAWMQRLGLEWLFRLYQEPGRLWKRYVLLNPAFLTRIGLEKLSLLRTPVLMPDGNELEESFG